MLQFSTCMVNIMRFPINWDVYANWNIWFWYLDQVSIEYFINSHIPHAQCSEEIFLNILPWSLEQQYLKPFKSSAVALCQGGGWLIYI